ncbi:MAG: SCP2 sterol-binding domain-containing protein [Chloroflexota bacterium]
MNVADIFKEMPNRLNVEKAKGMDATVQFDLSGADGGQWYVHVHDGKAETTEGTADSPTATIAMDADDYKALTSGKLNPMTAFMTGKIKVDGDLNAVMKFQTLFV